MTDRADRRAALVTCHDPLAGFAVHDIDRQVVDALSAARGLILIDLRAVTLVHNKGLSGLSEVLRRASKGGARVRVVGADPRVRWVLSLCAIDGMEFCRSMTRALLRHPIEAAQWAGPGLAPGRQPELERASSPPLS